MKSYFFLVFLFPLIASAQEAVEVAPKRSAEWSNETKWWMVAVFTIFIVILVLRTFRNKPSV